jgi:hypothetical protein
LRASLVCSLCVTAAHSRTPRSCFALVEHYGDALSAALYAREPTDALHTRFCAPICAAVDAAADAARQPADVSLACARLLRMHHAHALTAALHLRFSGGQNRQPAAAHAPRRQQYNAWRRTRRRRRRRAALSARKDAER